MVFHSGLHSYVNDYCQRNARPPVEQYSEDYNFIEPTGDPITNMKTEDFSESGGEYNGDISYSVCTQLPCGETQTGSVGASDIVGDSVSNYASRAFGGCQR